MPAERRPPHGGDPAHPPAAVRKLLVLALIGLLVGVPTLLLISIVTTRLPPEARLGSQPGGAVLGHVVDVDGRPLTDVLVEAWGGTRRDVEGRRAMLRGIWELDGDRRSLERLAFTRTAADGSFRLEVPAFEGYYGIAAGGGTWQRAYREVSYLGPEDEVVELEPLEFELAPGSTLEVDVRRRDGRRVGRGRYEITSRSGFLGIGATTLQSGEFEGTGIRLEALPPGEYEVEVALTTGEAFRATVDLEPGENPLRVDL